MSHNKKYNSVYTHDALWVELNKLFDLPKSGVKSFKLEVTVGELPIITIEQYAENSDTETKLRRFEIIDSTGDLDEN